MFYIPETWQTTDLEPIQAAIGRWPCGGSPSAAIERATTRQHWRNRGHGCVLMKHFLPHNIRHIVNIDDEYGGGSTPLSTAGGGGGATSDGAVVIPHVDPPKIDNDLRRDVLLYQAILSIVALIGGFVVLAVGAVLAIEGLSGNMTFGINISGVSANLSNAGPGMVLAVIGLGIVIGSLASFRVTIKSKVNV